MLQYLPSCILVVIYIILVFYFLVCQFIFPFVFNCIIIYTKQGFPLMHSVQWGITPPKITPLFFAKHPLKIWKLSKSPFQAIPLYIVFLWLPPPVPKLDFSRNPKNIKILTLSHLLKFLDLNFYYLYMIRSKTFLFIIFFCFYISDLIWFFV